MVLLYSLACLSPIYHVLRSRTTVPPSTFPTGENDYINNLQKRKNRVHPSPPPSALHIHDTLTVLATVYLCPNTRVLHEYLPCQSLSDDISLRNCGSCRSCAECGQARVDGICACHNDLLRLASSVREGTTRRP